MRLEKYHRCGTKQKRTKVSWGGNAFSNLEFSVWCKLVTVIYEKAFSGSYCLSVASRHSSGSLTSASFIVLLVAILQGKTNALDTTSSDGSSWTGAVSMPRSYPLVIPIGVIPRCVELSGSVARVWSVGKGRAITIVATWQQEKTFNSKFSKHLINQSIN